jgi:hypothetical protein
MRTIASMLPPKYRGVYGEQEHPNEGDDKPSSLL